MVCGITQATVLAHLGVAAQIIQRRTTMDIYAHEMPNEDAGAAVMLDQIFGQDKKIEPRGSSRAGKCA